jgi:hypothetical protein
MRATMRSSWRRSAVALGTLALVAAAGWLATGCTLFAEGDIPDVELVQNDLLFPAAPAGAAGMEVALSVPFKLRPGRIGIARDAFSAVRVLSVAITAKSGVTDLTFLHTARITLASVDPFDAGETLQQGPIEIARYARLDGAEVGPSVRVDSEPPTDVTDIWRTAPTVVFVAEITGELPTVQWTADISIRLGANVKY